MEWTEGGEGRADVLFEKGVCAGHDFAVEEGGAEICCCAGFFGAILLEGGVECVMVELGGFFCTGPRGFVGDHCFDFRGWVDCCSSCVCG